MVEACGISREPPRYLIHDRDGCFGASFNRRVASLNIRQIRTPVKAPKANAIAERWVRTIRNECLDHRLIFGHHHLQRTVDEFVAYYNRWRPHRSLGQVAPCPHVGELSRKTARHLISNPVLGGLHHVYQWAALTIPMEFLRPTTMRKLPAAEIARTASAAIAFTTALIS